MLLTYAIFSSKNMIFWKVVFYLGESITFEREGSIWMVSGTIKIDEKWSRRGSKESNIKLHENQEISMKFAKHWPSRSVAYTTRIWCFQFLRIIIFNKIWRLKMMKFKVQGWFLIVKNHAKMMTFGNMRNRVSYRKTHGFGRFWHLRNLKKWHRTSNTKQKKT